MGIILDNAITENSFKKKIYLLLLGIFLVFPLLFVLKTSFGIKGVILLFGMMLGIISIYNFYFSYSILLLLLFTPNIIAIHTAVIYSVFVFFSYLLNFYGNRKNSIHHPLIIPFLIYFATTLPSFINTKSIVFSSFGLYNLVALFSMLVATAYAFTSHKRIMNLIYVFLTGILLNGIIVIYLGLSSGKRVFGLLDVFYVDYAGLGSLLALILAIYSKGSKKFFWGVFSLIILYSLIITQTRNAWVSFGASFIILIIYLFFHVDKFKLRRHSLIGIVLTMSFFILVMYFSVATVNTDIQSRLSNQTDVTDLTESPESAGESSILQRFFIWHTAIVAFSEHPVIGIGAYSFPLASKDYYTIPKAFFKTFVFNKTSHVTFLSVLTETGIVGLIGFFIFIFSYLKLLLRTIKLPSEKNDIIRTLIISSALLYISISMFMTDAWLFGQQVVIWGIFLGLLVANYSLLQKKSDN